MAGSQFLLGENDDIAHARHKFQGFGGHVRRDDDGFFTQAPQHMAQRQRRAECVTVGRLMARDSNALHVIDE